MSAAGSTRRPKGSSGKSSPPLSIRADQSDGSRHLPLKERPASGTSRPHFHPTSSIFHSSPPSIASYTTRQNSDIVSAHSTRRKIEDLVLATVPSARPRRSETDQQAVKERDDLRFTLVDVVEEALKEREVESIDAIDQSAIVERLKRHVSAYDWDGSSGLGVRFDNSLSRLQRQSGLSDILKGLLILLNDLSGTSRVTSVGDGADAARSRSIQPSSAQPSATSKQVCESSEAHSPANMPHTRNEPTREGEMPGQSQDVSVAGHSRLAENISCSGISPAALLRQRREILGIAHIDEQLLVQDVLYLLQGIPGKYVRFEDAVLPASNNVGEVRDAAKIIQLVFSPGTKGIISAPTKELVQRIAELGRLYMRIKKFVDVQAKQHSSGLMTQSLHHFLSFELGEYYRLIAILEGQMRSKTQNDASSGAQQLTLRKIAALTRDVMLRMRLLSTIVESCQDTHGGALLSLIHSYTFHGDPLIQRCTAEILEHVSKPFFQILSRWIFEGELQDPFNEFFVSKRLMTSAMETLADQVSSPQAGEGEALHEGERPKASSLWQKQYHFRPEMLPSFLDEAFGMKIFSAGKSLNFIRFSCGDAEWNDMVRKADEKQQRETSLRYADLRGLQRNIDAAYESASERLLDILMGKFKLLSHLRALKEYLMLTKGDFTDLLLESIGPSLDKPASSLFRHNLTASLETTIRGSSSQYDDVDIVGRLDARVLDFQDGDTGWDSFTLEYRIDEPISTILDAHALSGYQVIFNHLWKMKRVESTLSRCWERLLLAANSLRRARPRCASRLPLSNRARQALTKQITEESTAVTMIDADLKLLYNIAHQALVHLGEQLHFVRQMQGFISLEAIEYSWNDLTQLLADRNAKTHLIDLDEVIASHRAYLNALIAKIMLRSTSSSPSSRRDEQLTQEVRTTMDTMLSFARTNEDLSRFIIDEVACFNVSSRQGDQKDDQVHSQTSLQVSSTDLQARLQSIHLRFQQSTRLIIAKLERHSNLVVRDLATRLNFNSYYFTGSHQYTANSSAAAHGQDSSGHAGAQQRTKT